MSRTARNFSKIQPQMSQSCDISNIGAFRLLSEQENRKDRAFPNLRSYPDIAALQGDNFTGQIQPDPDPLHIMYGVLPVKPFEDCSLVLLWNPNASVGNVNLQIHFPCLHLHMNLTARRCVLHGVVQNIKQRFARPLPVMARLQMLRAIHLDVDLFLFGTQQDTAQCSREGIINRLLLFLQRDNARFQPGGLYHGLHKKVQFVKLACLRRQKFLLLLRRNVLLH